MKTIFVLFMVLISTVKINAQTTITTTTIIVKGNCDDCKERIENAADIKGVKHAVWNKNTKVLSVTYNIEKVSLEKIEQAIAKAGYETPSVKASSKAYSALPECCKYQTTNCKK